ncbi:MAG: TVP38/TMEM64 family protein [Proteobacteria bacterium]|nr:TVP38/TMEM64 family protein [Pseudomonadota bacterium]
MNARGERTDDGERALPRARWSILAGAAIAVLVAALGLVLWRAGLFDVLWKPEALRRAVIGLGAWGPAALIALEVTAIVFSPIPSGPIAVAAGAAFGPFWGTIYIVIGAVVGAMIAFTLARCFGYEAVRRWAAAEKIVAYLSRSRSQWWLTGIVFASRLVPFISFDAVSYAAGLTPLAYWRFALATIAGVIPVSILLAYAGEGLVEASGPLLAAALLVLATLTLAPVGLKIAWNAWSARRRGIAGDATVPPGDQP